MPKCIMKHSSSNDIGVGVKRSIALVLVATGIIAGCETSSDLTYDYRANAAECNQISRDIVQARKVQDSKRVQSLNQRFYQNCTGR